MRSLIALLLVFCLNNCFSQTLPDFASVKLKKKGDYKAAEPSVTQAVNYVLSTPFVKDEPNRVNATAFIIKWMSGTPHYTFTLDEKVVGNLLEENPDLMGLYMACMIKYSFENVEAKEKTVNLNALKLLLTYCDDRKNNIKMTDQLKKLSDANKKGSLEQEL